MAIKSYDFGKSSVDIIYNIQYGKYQIYMNKITRIVDGDLSIIYYTFAVNDDDFTILESHEDLGIKTFKKYKEAKKQFEKIKHLILLREL